MPLNRRLLSLLVCPACRAKLIYDPNKNILVCKSEKLAYPIREDVPVMLIEEAYSLTIDEIKQYD